MTNRGCVKDYANLRCQPDNSNAGTPSPSPFNLGGYHGSLDSPVGDSPSPAAGNEKSVHVSFVYINLLGKYWIFRYAVSPCISAHALIFEDALGV